MSTDETQLPQDVGTNLLGRTITLVRYLTYEEAEELGWDFQAPVLHLDDGTLLFPSSDDEGNGPGALFGQSASGTEFDIPIGR